MRSYFVGSAMTYARDRQIDGRTVGRSSKSMIEKYDK